MTTKKQSLKSQVDELTARCNRASEVHQALARDKQSLLRTVRELEAATSFFKALARRYAHLYNEEIKAHVSGGVSAYRGGRPESADCGGYAKP